MEDKERRLQEMALKVLEEDALGDIVDTSDTEIEKSNYKGRAVHVHKIQCSINGNPETTRGGRNLEILARIPFWMSLV